MNFIVTVKQRDVMKHCIYKMRCSTETYISIKNLIKLGANIVPERGDIVVIDKVSDMLYDAINGMWLRK